MFDYSVLLSQTIHWHSHIFTPSRGELTPRQTFALASASTSHIRELSLVSLVASNSLANTIVYPATTTQTSMGYSSTIFRRALFPNIPFATIAFPNPTVTSEPLKTEASFAHLDWLLAVGPP